MWGDASAALGIINRNGLLKTRHIVTSLLRVPETGASQRFEYETALGRDNPVDLYIKYLDTSTGNHHAKNLKFGYEEGRAEEAPKLHKLSRSMDEYIIGRHHQAWEWLTYMESNGQRRRGSLKLLTPSQQTANCHNKQHQSISVASGTNAGIGCNYNVGKSRRTSGTNRGCAELRNVTRRHQLHREQWVILM